MAKKDLFITSKFSFKILDDRINKHRDALLDAMETEYEIARKTNADISYLSREYVQKKIYKRFKETVTAEELAAFKGEFYELTKQRDIALQQYSKHIEDKILGWKGNNNLVRAHFIHSINRDKSTNVKNTTITPVKVYYDENNEETLEKPEILYYNEKTLEKVIREDPWKYIPHYMRSNGSIASIDEIEIMATSNMTGLYNPMTVKKGKESEHLTYTVLKRVKNSEREMKKFLDWLADLRSEEDYPYDAIAMRIIIPDKKMECGEVGKQIYLLRDQIVSELEKNGQVIQKNVNTREENKKSPVKKLQREGYDYQNFMEVTRQMRDTNKYLEKKKIKSEDLTEDQRESLLQYVQIKGFVKIKEDTETHKKSNKERIEIQIMTEEMDLNYSGDYVGHNSGYIARRDAEREDYIKHPEESPARKEAREREERKKYGGNTKKKNQYQTIIKEPDLTVLMGMLGDLYRPVFKLYAK